MSKNTFYSFPPDYNKKEIIPFNDEIFKLKPEYLELLELIKGWHEKMVYEMLFPTKIEIELTKEEKEKHDKYADWLVKHGYRL